MDQRNKQAKCRCYGCLPPKAPLANPFVPFQEESPSRYEPRRALIRGTLYPCLDLPFMGMSNKTEKPVTAMTELQVLAFMVQELALYLDTHPDDAEALKQYRTYQKLYHDCAMRYTENRRPLTHSQPTDAKEYNWLCDPWPWEYAANREG